jgi:hypothetical protein
MDQAEIRAALIGRSGTPQELAEVVGLDAQNRTFQRALSSLVDDGLLEAQGTTRDRRYVPTVGARIGQNGHGHPAPPLSPSSGAGPQRDSEGNWPPVRSKHTGEPLPLDPETGVPLSAEQIRANASPDDWARASALAVKASGTGSIGSGTPRTEKKKKR